jgi:3-hydroxyisobutyrate dehydrogenase-like beta-hydroxyacid dehydrogenase
MTSSHKVAFLGLGVMGYPMAGHLAAAGHDMTVYNRTAAKAAAWTGQHGGKAAASPREAVDGAEFVFCCVGNDNDVRAVVLGESGAFAGMSAHAVLVDHTTASADLARELETAAKARGLRFLDAPVSGGEAGAKNGALTVMVGGEEGTFADARQVIDAYARACALMGPAGSGQLAKMCNQICIAGIVQGLAEATNFGVRAGLDMEKVFEVISKGAAQSWQMENRYKTMLAGQYEFGFAVDWMRKDLGICLAEGNTNEARLPVTALVDQFYAHVQARGGGRWDTSSLLHLLVDD